MSSITTTSQQGMGPAYQPWDDYATQSVPDNHNNVLWWAEYLWLSNSTYKTAMGRVCDHFLTEIDFPDLETDEETEYRDMFADALSYKMAFRACAEDLLAYGSVCVSLYQPFDRRMLCRACNFEQRYARAAPKVEYSTQAPYVRFNRTKGGCPQCGDQGSFKCVDRPNPDVSKIKLIRYPLRDIHVAQNAFSERRSVWLRASCRWLLDIRSGAEIHVSDTPMEILEAVARGTDFKFAEDSFLFVGVPALSGLYMKGWGLSPSISSFRLAWLQQTYNKTDQAIAADYTLGMRIISPAPTAGGNDPMVAQGTNIFVERMSAIVKSHRRDPARFYTAPHAMQYQFLGGEGANLLPPDKLEYRQNEFLNGMGVPGEFYKMSLSVQAAPMALRLFENAWQLIPAFYNSLLSFMMKETSMMLGKPRTKAIMRRSAVADDMERKQILGQLMASNQISPQTFLESFGINAAAEVRKVYRHQEYVAGVQREFDQKQQDQQEMGALSALAGNPSPSTLAQQIQQTGQGPGGGLVAGPPPGGPGGGGGGGAPGTAGGPQSLTEMSAQAEQQAQQLVGMQEGPRKQQLKMLRETSKDFHSLVMSAMERIRSQAGAQGRMALTQQPAQ